MQDFDTVEKVLDFAISEEEKARQFYTELAEQAKNPAMKNAMLEFASEEAKHKSKLESVKAGKLQFTSEKGKSLPNLRIADYTVQGEPSPVMTYQESLILAMKKEKAAYRLYLDLASVAQSEQLTETFLSLAAEEAKHKLRFEIEYDDVILKEN